jgi:hypothetical protein
LNVSEQQSQPTSAETGSVGTGSAAPDISAAREQLMMATPSLVETPVPVSGQEATALKPDATKVEAVKADATEAETSRTEAPKVEAVKAETTKAEPTKAAPPPIPGQLLIMSPGERGWTSEETTAERKAAPSEKSSGKRRVSAMAAVVALATVAGAMGGALATAGLGHFLGNNAAASNNHVLEASVARIDADITALKASVEHTSKVGVSQFNKTSDRLDKVEKAQYEPAAKLAKLSDAVEKLRAQQPAPTVVAAAAPAAARDVTGTVSAPVTAAAAPVPLPAPKPEIARLPTVEGWVLRDVENGSALIESRRGTYEVYAGDPVPGLGRVDAIRKQDGRWVVVTSKGLIVAR